MLGIATLFYKSEMAQAYRVAPSMPRAIEESLQTNGIVLYHHQTTPVKWAGGGYWAFGPTMAE